MSQENNKEFGHAQANFTYTRADALEDGTLVDVSETAKQAGIKFPVALTAAVYEKYVKVPAGVKWQQESLRLWDILWMFRCAARNWELHHDQDRVLLYEVYVRNHNRETDNRDLVTLKAPLHPGDDGEPVITIMLPEED